MSEKKRFRLGPAVVNFNAMKLDIAEAVVDIANTSLRYAVPAIIVVLRLVR